MSTRGTFGFRVDGVDKITFNRFDSYIMDGLGEFLVRDICHYGDRRLLATAKRIEMVRFDAIPTDAQIEECAAFSYKGQTFTWRYLINGASLAKSIRPWGSFALRYMGDSSWFRQDVCCDYSYLIDMDSGVFEIYARMDAEKITCSTPEEINLYGDFKIIPRKVISMPLSKIRANPERFLRGAERNSERI